MRPPEYDQITEERISQILSEISSIDECRFLNISALDRKFKLESEVQGLLRPNDYRHNKMYSVSECKTYFTLYWGGYPYHYELGRISRPEDAIWLLVHLSEKGWRYMTAKRVGLLLSTIAGLKGWEPYGRVLHPNEAPKPNFDKIREREKMTPQLRYKVIRRDGYRCRACGFSVQDGAHLHVDHIVPIAKHGATEIENLQTLCTACNIGKGAE